MIHESVMVSFVKLMKNVYECWSLMLFMSRLCYLFIDVRIFGSYMVYFNQEITNKTNEVHQEWDQSNLTQKPLNVVFSVDNKSFNRFSSIKFKVFLKTYVS